MKRVFFVLTVLASISCGAQTVDSLFSFSFDRVSFEKFVSEVEAATEYKFFYVNRWVDTLVVSAEVHDAGIGDVLKQTLKNTKVQFYILENRIILTNNVPIIESKLALQYDDKDLNRPEVSYSFAREDRQEELTETVSDAIIPIGIRKPFYSNEKFAVSGYIKEEKSGEPLPGASVFVKDEAGGTTSNTAGFYTITMSHGSHDHVVQFAGMNP